MEDKDVSDEEQSFRRRMALAEEERLAWDHYAGRTFIGFDIYDEPLMAQVADRAARFADALLEERRKRFGGPAK